MGGGFVKFSRKKIRLDFAKKVAKFRFFHESFRVKIQLRNVLICFFFVKSFRIVWPIQCAYKNIEYI